MALSWTRPASFGSRFVANMAPVRSTMRTPLGDTFWVSFIGDISIFFITLIFHFIGITAGIMFLAFLMDLVVWRKAHRIDIAPDQQEGATDAAPAPRLDVSESKQPIAPAPDTTV